MLLETNHGTVDQFKQQVVIQSSRLFSGNQGVSFEAVYRFKIGWAESRARDWFVVKSDSSTTNEIDP